MRCFDHRDSEAVGLCKSCGKGVCSACALDLGKGLACKGRCEEDVRALIGLIDRNIKLSPTTSRLIEASGSARTAGALFLLVCGAVFLVFGLLSHRRFDFAAILGACFIAYGAFAVWWSRKVAAKAAPGDVR